MVDTRASRTPLGSCRMRMPLWTTVAVPSSTGSVDAHRGSTIPTSISRPDGIRRRRSVTIGPHRRVRTTRAPGRAAIQALSATYVAGGLRDHDEVDVGTLGR